MKMNGLHSTNIVRLGLLALMAFSHWGCQPRTVSTQPAVELVLRTWDEDLPEDLFADFTQKTGVPVRFDPYEAQEDAISDLQLGKPSDILVIDSRFIPILIENELISVIDRSNVPNFRYISPGFRGLLFDPDNQYSIPFQWGTTGIVYRRDLAGREITKWSDLWDPAFKGKVGLWKGLSREAIGLTLKMLGYSANSENPDEIDAAMEKLSMLQPDLVWAEAIDPYTAVPGLLDGRLIVALGYAYDEIEGQKANPNIKFVLPAEGSLLWGDNFVIPSTSVHKTEAEALLNYLLEPEVMAKIANFNYYAVANDGAMPFIEEEIRSSLIIYPPNDLLIKSEIILSISPEAEDRYLEAWEKFTASSLKDAP